MDENQNSNQLVLIAKSAPVTTGLVILNIAVFLISTPIMRSSGLEGMVKIGANYAPLVVQGQIWRLLTCMFLHFDIRHLFSNMLGLFFLGSIVEQELQRRRYIILYFGSGLFASTVSLISSLLFRSGSVSAGASGAVFGLIGSLVMIMIRRKGKFRGMRPQNLAFMVIYSLFAGFTTSGIDNAAHVGGLIAGLFITSKLYNPVFLEPETDENIIDP